MSNTKTGQVPGGGRDVGTLELRKVQELEVKRVRKNNTKFTLSRTSTTIHTRSASNSLSTAECCGTTQGYGKSRRWEGEAQNI